MKARGRARYTRARTLSLLLVWLFWLPAGAARAGASASSVSREYEVGSIRAGARRWRPAELDQLRLTFSRLHSRELAAVNGVDFVRGAAPRQAFGAGLFSWDRRGRRIILYDRAFGPGERDGLNWTVVHEIGHAISAWDLVQERRRSKKAIDAYNGSVSAYNKSVLAYNEAARRFNLTREPTAQREADRLRASVSARRSAMVAAREKALASKRRVGWATRQFKSPRPTEGVLADYRRVLGRARGPTRYGRTNLRESFAESFAMYRCDPGGLRSALPAVSEWFRRGGHLARLPR